MSEPAVRRRGRDDRTYPLQHTYRIIHPGVKGSFILPFPVFLPFPPFIFRPFRCDEKKKVTKKKAELFHGHVLAQESTSARNATSREEELRQVRLRQQELADERSKEAARLAKEKELLERERKNHVAKKPETGGDRLGRSTTTTTTTPTPSTSSTTKKSINSSSSSSATSSTSSRSDPPTFNPLQPWASHSTGYR